VLRYLRWFILGMAFMLGASALAIDPPAGSPAKSPFTKDQAAKSAVKKPVPRETRMRVTGVVTEITGDTIRIERAVTAELMAFTLEKAPDKIKAGDKVTISYIQKEEKNIALRVNKAVAKKKAVTAQSGATAPSPSPAPKP
jgi:hypothetical protein